MSICKLSLPRWASISSPKEDDDGNLADTLLLDNKFCTCDHAAACKHGLATVAVPPHGFWVGIDWTGNASLYRSVHAFFATTQRLNEPLQSVVVAGPPTAKSFVMRGGGAKRRISAILRHPKLAEDLVATWCSSRCEHGIQASTSGRTGTGDFRTWK